MQGPGARIVNHDTRIQWNVNSLTGGKGVDVIFDLVGGDLFDQCARCINWKGRILVVGFASARSRNTKPIWRFVRAFTAFLDVRTASPLVGEAVPTRPTPTKPC